MEPLLEAIRAATAPDATDDIKTAGANACRTLAAVLETKAGEPLAAPIAPTATPAQNVINVLRTMQAEQLLDLAIARLRAALPAGAEVAAAQPVKFQMLPLPPVTPRDRS
jgi:hypothetical protein